MSAVRNVLVAASLVLAATGCAPEDSEVDGGGVGADDVVVASPTPSPVAVTASDPTPMPSPSDDIPSPTAGPDDGRVLTAADDGASIELVVGGQATLLQADPSATDPRVDGTSVELVEVVNVQASGRREWEVRAITPGATTLAVPDGDTTFALEVVVD